jgi:hypothetical protein
MVSFGTIYGERFHLSNTGTRLHSQRIWDYSSSWCYRRKAFGAVEIGGGLGFSGGDHETAQPVVELHWPERVLSGMGLEM